MKKVNIDNNSLAHTELDCKYYIVFAPNITIKFLNFNTISLLFSQHRCIILVVRNMKTKDSIKTTALLSVMSALVTVLLVLGGFFDVLDLACASVAALIIHIICCEHSYKHAFLVYAVSAVLSNIFLPLRSCPIVFAAFFGYFPIIRLFLNKKIKLKKLVYVLLLAFYNVVMIGIYFIFKEIFGITNEPYAVIIALLFSANLFYVAFELLLRRIMILYNYYIKKNVKNSKRD